MASQAQRFISPDENRIRGRWDDRNRDRGRGRRSSEVFEERYHTFYDPHTRDDPFRIYSDLSIIVHSRQEEPAEEAFLSVLKRYYPGAAIILVDQSEGTWRRVHLRSGQSSELRSKAANAASSTLCENPLLEALRNCKTGSVVVMSGSSRHPAERIVGMLEELRRGYEVVVSADFSCAYGGIASEECESITELYFARRRCKRKGFEVSDPYSRFYAGNTRIIQDALKKTYGSRRVKNANLLPELLRALPRGTEFLQMHHAEYFSPGYIASKHLNPGA